MEKAIRFEENELVTISLLVESLFNNATLLMEKKKRYLMPKIDTTNLSHKTLSSILDKLRYKEFQCPFVPPADYTFEMVLSMHTKAREMGELLYAIEPGKPLNTGLCVYSVEKHPLYCKGFRISLCNPETFYAPNDYVFHIGNVCKGSSIDCSCGLKKGGE